MSLASRLSANRLSACLPDRLAAQLAAPAALVRAVVRHDWRFLAITLAACSVAGIVTCFQYQVYTSFVRAGAAAPRFIGGTAWISANSIACFDFPSPIAEDYGAALARWFPRATIRRVAFGFTTWTSPTGQRGNVAVIGLDGASLPDGRALEEYAFMADRSDLARLNLAQGSGQQATLGGQTLRFAGTTSRLPSFLGAAYVVTTFDRARAVLGMDPGAAAFLVLDEPGGLSGQALEPAMAQANAQYPEITVRSAASFAASSSAYWQRKTGAGSAILLAAVLASVLMVILLANGVLRFMQRYAQDLLSMLGHGAGQRDIWLVAGGIAMVVAGATLLAMLLITPLMILLARPFLPWVSFQPADALLPACGVILALAMAILGAGRAVRDFGPEAVFRT